MKGTLRIGGALVAAAVVITAGAFLREQAAPQPEPSVQQVVNTRSAVAIDSDGDGVMDWEEELTKQLFEKVSTPIEEPLTATDREGEDENTPQTYTEQFSRSFFEDFMQSKTGNRIGQDREQFLNAAIASIENSTQSRIYTKKDLHVVPDTSLVSVRNYGNQISSIAEQHTIEGVNELVIFYDALQTKDRERLQELDQIHDAYKGAIAETLNMPVPASLTNEHLALVNAYEALRTDVEAMGYAFTDPLYALARVQRYEGNLMAGYRAFWSINQYLVAQGVVYTEDEPGSFLNAFEQKL